MVAVRLEGRLGNQLFQYAFIYSAAKKINTGFYIDKSIEAFLLPEYFHISDGVLAIADRSIFSIRGFKNFFSHHLRRAFYKVLERIFLLKEVRFSDDLPAESQLGKIRNGTMNIGYFQSEIYFTQTRAEIRQLFSVKENYRSEYEQIRRSLPKGLRYVVIHVRKGDYVDLKLDLPSSYYHKAIKEIESDNNFYIIISDSPDFAEEEFRYLQNRYVSANCAIVDLQFMMNADVCILSNSSFSWWGAYLNKRSARVMAPKFWSGRNKSQEFPRDILLDHWTLVE